MGLVMGRTILQMDEPEHRHRTAPSCHRASAPRCSSAGRRSWCAVVVNELIDSFVDRGHADLVREVTFNFPVQVIARILGLPRSDFPMFQRWAIELTSVRPTGSAASRPRRPCATTSPGCMEERRASRATTSSATWCVAEVDGRKPRATRRSTPSSGCCCRPGSRPPTAPRAACSTACSPTGPSSRRSSTDRYLYAQAFEEAVRWEPPVTVILRRATCDTELAGVPIERGRRHRARCSAPPTETSASTPTRTATTCSVSRASTSASASASTSASGMHLARMESRVADQHALRPPRSHHPGPRRGAAAHRGVGVPLPALAPRGVRGPFGTRRRRLGSSTWAAEPTRCAMRRPSLGSGRPSSPSRSTGPRASWRPRRSWRRCGTPASTPSEVDGLSSFTMESTDEVTLAKTIGAGDITYFSQVGYGGGAGCATVGHAAMAIATGQADVVVAWRSRKRGARAATAVGGGTLAAPDSGAVDQAVRAPAPGRRGRHARPPLHARVRRRAGAPGRGGHGRRGPTPTVTRLR